MNQQQRAVVQQALEAMGNITNYERLEKARAALRQLLEQPEPVQEPDIFPDEAYEMGLERIAYYTTPPAQPADHSEQHLDMVDHADELTIAYLDGVHTGKQIAKREWVDLTDDEQDEIAAYHGLDCMVYKPAFHEIKTKLRQKNGITTPPAQPAVLSLEDSLKVTKVCCGDYANCHAPCTPRGRWQAHQEPAAWVGLTDEQKHQLNEALNLQGRFPVIDAIEAMVRKNNGGAV